MLLGTQRKFCNGLISLIDEKIISEIRKKIWATQVDTFQEAVEIIERVVIGANENFNQLFDKRYSLRASKEGIRVTCNFCGFGVELSACPKVFHF